ncbi:MAG: rane protein [Flaviaesturariibacter sp.]|nr:rane protein [Flaviaesturariibacter sp.]
MATTSLETALGIKRTIGKVSIVIALFATSLVGCKTMSNTQKGGVIGGAAGGAVGAVIGRAIGNTAVGAIIGAAVGGTAGVLIGRKMDKQAEEMAKEMKDAEIRREGEGIVVNFKEKVLFGYDRYDLNANAQANLNQLRGYLLKYPETNITVIGHTDSKGSDTYNQTLSENRANAAVNYLRQNGIAATRLTAIGKGEADPIATNDTEEGASSNRRVEFVITANEKMKADAKAEAGQ